MNENNNFALLEDGSLFCVAAKFEGRVSFSADVKFGDDNHTLQELLEGVGMSDESE
jgi:hypothetical protein